MATRPVRPPTEYRAMCVAEAEAYGAEAAAQETVEEAEVATAAHPIQTNNKKKSAPLVAEPM